MFSPAAAVARCAVIAAVVAFTACSSPPTRELEQARGVIEAARSVGAERDAPEQFAAAIAAFERAEAAVAEGDYRQALSYALDAREHGREAVRVAAESRAQARGQAERDVAVAEAALARATTARDRATQARTPARDLARAARALEDGRALVLDARQAIDAGDLDAARSRLRQAIDLLTSATSEFDAAVERQRARRVPRGDRR